MRQVAALMLVVWAVVLAGCNTMRGLGQDIERAGEAIQRKSDK
jgi:predicted small secreted protein